MADAKITELTELTSPAGTDLLPIVDDVGGSPITKKISLTNLLSIGSATSHIIGEVVSGDIDGVNDEFTLANTPISGTVRVYHNRTRLKLTDDYTISGAVITLIDIPVTGDVVVADYMISAGDFATGSASFVSNEVPSGLVNSSNVTFTLVSTPVTGTLQLFRDGQLMKGGGVDYTLTTNSIEFVTAPTTGSVLLAFYQSSVSTVGNADTLDGQHAPIGDIVGTTDTQTLTNKTLTSPKLNENVALTSTSTELNALDGKTGAWSAYTPSTSGITVGNGTISARYLQIGKLVFAMVKFTLGSTSAIGTDPRIQEPVTAYGLPETLGNARFVDKDTFVHYQGWWRQGYIGYSGTTYGQITSTVPFTWATDDTIWLSIMYEAQ